MASKTVLPAVYYFTFGIYEPIVALVIFLGVLADPKSAHDLQGPWRSTPPENLPTPTLITIFQLSYLCAVLGLINAYVLHAAKKHAASQPALQEKIVGALLKPILFGDIAHIVLTVYALTVEGWAVDKWPSVVWVTFAMGISLFIPRLAWILGVGRYVEGRDGHAALKRA